MKDIYITQFNNIFGILFSHVTNIEHIGADTDDDGIYHYIDIANKDIYSFDTNDNIWLEKNLYKTDILHRLNITIQS